MQLEPGFSYGFSSSTNLVPDVQTAGMGLLWNWLGQALKRYTELPNTTKYSELGIPALLPPQSRKTGTSLLAISPALRSALHRLKPGREGIFCLMSSYLHSAEYEPLTKNTWNDAHNVNGW